VSFYLSPPRPKSRKKVLFRNLISRKKRKSDFGVGVGPFITEKKSGGGFASATASNPGLHRKRKTASELFVLRSPTRNFGFGISRLIDRN